MCVGFAGATVVFPNVNDNLLRGCQTIGVFANDAALLSNVN